MLNSLIKRVASGRRRSSARSSTNRRPKSRPSPRPRFEPLERRLVLDAGPLVIAELMADNDSTLTDGDGDYSDWIEIHNPTNMTIGLGGWCLTDDAEDLTKWRFPAGSLDPGEHLLVFASGKASDGPPGELHTNFQLAADGEYLGLVQSDGYTIAHEYAPAYPPQLEDVSFGLADATSVWDTLVAADAEVRYHVPGAGEDVFAWTDPAYDDSAWIDAVTLPAPTLLVTEIDAGATDWLEIQNVSATAVDTSGWIVAVNDTSSGNIGDVHGVVWNLPQSVAAGEILYRTDDQADNYFGTDIAWETGSGWVMIVDGGGHLVDFFVWGYDQAEVASLVVDVGGFTGIAVGDQWRGDGTRGGSGDVDLLDVDAPWSYDQNDVDLGTSWRTPGYDDSGWPSGDALLYVEGSGLPAPKNTPLTLGATTYYFRTHFTLDAHPASVTQLEINTVIDDGAVFYLNGVEVHRLGIDPGPINHSTYADRTVGNAGFEGPFSIPPGSLVADDNLLAVEVHQTNSGSSDIVFGLDLSATVLEPVLGRTGNSDANRPGDFDVPAAATKGTQNPGLSVPFAEAVLPALTGVGFSDDGDFDGLVRTDVAAAVQGVNASLWARMEFPVGDTAQFDELLLRMKYDDGYLAYLNGVEVARSNAPDPPAFDSAATAEHPDAQAVVFEDTDISDLAHLLRGMATNVLAIHGLNLDAADGDLLVLPELIATSILDDPQYMTAPTPGAANVAGALGIVQDTQFSVDRGFYNAPFQVQISTDTAGAEIRYTLDSSTPTATTGTVYTGPIAIGTTTTLRAGAFKPGYIPTNVDTHTYIFLGDVVRQPANPPGFPSSWGGTTADYQMDPDVVGDPRYQNQMRSSLLSLPTMSIVTDVNNLFGASGIYQNSGSQGYAWERPTSVEWINTDGTTGFQVDAGLRIYGGAFRGMNLTRKKTFRLLFKREYGPTKLNFPMFDSPDAATRFDTIILRGGANDGWNNWGDADTQYIVDEFMRRTQLALGQPSGHGTFVHLYVNGLYWGLYNPVERPEASFSATYFGGDKQEWDALNSASPTGESNTATWNAMLNQVRAGLSDMASYQRIQGNNPDGTDNPAYDDLLDMDNYIDYMFSNFFGGTGDWPGHNWYAACRRPPNAEGWKFYNWDSEGAICVWSSLNANRTGVNNSAAEPYAELRNNEEFNLLFGDHVRSHMFNGGPATAEASHARYQQLADEVELAIIAESARWGDQARATPYTLADWQATRDYVLNTYMPQRPAVVLDQLRNAGLYPQMDAPALSQHGGQVPPGFELTMTVDQTPFYQDTVIVPEFTQARFFVPNNNNLGTTWTQWGFADAAWGAGETGMGYENSPSGYDNLIHTRVKPQDTDPDATAILLRIPFTVDDLAVVDKLTLRMKYDDGYVAYINGQEVTRRNFTGTPGWNSTASSHPDGDAVRFEDVDVSTWIGVLNQSDQNVLAIHALNTGTGSSDMLVLPELVVGTEVVDPGGPDIYYTTDGSDPRLPGGGISGSAVPYDGGPVVINGSTPLRARTHQAGQWSAVCQAQFFVDQPAAAANLVVTEINYDPYDPMPAELLVDPALTAGDFEFIELTNHSGDAVSLTGVKITDGVQFEFDFGQVSRLGPGKSVVVAANPAAFQLRYPAAVNLTGKYENQLRNEGEQIELMDFFGGLIARFSYDNEDGWPGRAAGKGASLELIDPALVPHAEPDRALYLEDPDNWRSSSEYGGSPGRPGSGPLGDVVVNEVLTHTDPPLIDTIELYNTTAGDVFIGGWYLSDSWGWESDPANGNYRKFRIPDATTIPAHGYVVFDEDDFNPTPQDPLPHHFALKGAHNDDVWLMEADATGRLVRFVDHVEFGAAAQGESWGRWPNGLGDMYPMTLPTLSKARPQDGPNSGPRIGPLLISELHYNPTPMDDDDDLEFIEIYNSTGAEVELTDWRIRGGIDYDFLAGTTLGPFAELVVLPFAPIEADKWAAFCTQYGLDPGDTDGFLGGYTGQLRDEGERVRLQRPDEEPEDEPGFIPRLLEDEVRYDNQLPWPTLADGGAMSLTRAATDAWGHAPASWGAALPTPGSTSFPLPDAQVVGRHVFYNESAFDGNDETANAGDDAAIAPDKQALLPGQTASSANYTSFSRGINGVMIDVDGLPPDAVPSADDFRFRLGNDNDPGNWAILAEAPSITVRPAAGTGGSDRITLVWPTGTIQKQWLQLTVLATPDTGLPHQDVFYYGNAIGESGNSTSDAKVGAIDMLGARDNQRNFLNPAPIDFPYDYDRDSKVNSVDMLIARNNQTHFLSALRLITVPGDKAAAERAGDVDRSTASDAVLGQTAHRDGSAAALDWLLQLDASTLHASTTAGRPARDGVRSALAPWMPSLG